MEIFSRAALKGFFQKGRIPTEVHFSNLIDSTINKIDDGFAKTPEHGLKLAPGGETKKLISLYDDIKEKDPQWDVSLNPTESAKGLSFSEKNAGSRVFLQNGGEVGIGTISPKHKLHIEGTAAMKSRVGTFESKSQVAADGEWHSIIGAMGGCHAYEVVLKVEGAKGRGKYAMAHLIAINANGRTKIKVTQAYYGWYWHRLRFRWKGNKEGQKLLEVRTADHYGVDENRQAIQIRFHVTSLWDDKLDILTDR